MLAARLSLPLAGCDVAWGGASFSLENPAPEPVVAEGGAAAPEEIVEPLPEGPLLYLVRFVSFTGEAEIVATASFRDGRPGDLGVPAAIDQAYRARFDSAFYAPDTELTLHAGGQRIGQRL